MLNAEALSALKKDLRKTQKSTVSFGAHRPIRSTEFNS